MNESLKLLIIDDHPAIREGLRAVISLEPDLEVVGDAGSASEAFELVTHMRPDIAIVDISLPGRNGIELIKDIRKISGETRMVVYTMHDANIYADRAFKAGAHGYVMKEKGASQVVEAIRQAVKDRRFLCPDESEAAEREGGGTPVPDDLPIGKLSDRQLEIFELVGSGLTSHNIGEKLSLSHKTVNAHKMNIQDKLGIGSARELLMAATRWVDRRRAG